VAAGPGSADRFCDIEGWTHRYQRQTRGEVNRMIAAVINVDPRWFWEGPDV
jgi:hypothetical protein